MAKQLNVSLGFTADTSQAKAQLQDLQRQLQSLTSGAMNRASLTGGLSKDLQGAISAATQLKVQLENATNVNTGKLDLGKFSESLDKSGMKLSDYRRELEKLGPEGAQAFMSLATSISNAEVPMRRTNALVKEFATTLKNTARWQISSSMLHGFMGTLQSAYGYAKDLNESLNNIRIVTGQTTEQMDAFAAKANKAAKALSTTTTAYTDAALIYYQQGLDDSAVEERTNVTIKMAHAAGESATEVSSYMTAIWNNFAKGSENLEYYGDVMAALGAKTAASSAEIAEGLEKFSAIGETVGLSYEYAASAVATVVDKTRQSADTVGTAFKTIFSRLQGLQLGETLEDGTDLNKYSSALMSVGISIKDANGELKDMDVILDEMGAKWQTLHRDEQMALAQTVAGVRQYTQLMSLMNNYDSFKENISTAETSSGTLEKQAEIYAESWEGAQERVRAAAEKIYSSLLNDDFFITMLNGFEKVLTGVGNLIDGLGGLKGVLFAVSAIMTKLFQNEMAKGLNNMAYNISMMTEKGRNKVTEKKEQAWDEASKLTAKDGTTVGDTQHTNIQQTSELQKLMLQNAEKMSEEELKQNQLLLDAHKILQENAVAAAKELDVAQQKTSELSKQARAESKRNGNTSSSEYMEARKHLKEQAEGYAKQSKAVDTFRKALKSAGTDQAKLSAAVKDFRKSDAFKGASAELKSLVRAADEGRIGVDNLGDSIDRIEMAQDDAWVDSMDAFAESTGVSIQTADQLGGQLVATAQSEMQYSNATNAAANNTETLRQRLQNAGVGTTDFARSLVACAQTISTVAMVGTSLAGMWDTLSNPDVSGMEKFTTILTTLGMILPMVTSAFNKQNLAQMATVSTAIMAALGLDTEAISAIAAGTATAGFGATLWTVLWPIGLVMAAIGLLVGIVMILVNVFKSIAANTPEGKLKALEERADKSAEAFNRVSEAVNETKEAINNLETAYDTIEGLTEGTNEWYEAITNANAEVLKLIEKFPELQEMGFVSQENGLMKISDEGFDYIAEQNRQRLQAANNVKTNDQIAVAEQKRVVSYTNDYKDTDGYNIGSYLAEAMQNFYEHDQVGETMFTAEGSKALLETLQEAGYYLGYTAEEFHDIVLENQDIIRKNAAAADNIQMMNDSIMMSHMASLGSNRTTEQTKELLGENAYQEIRDAKRAEIEGKVTTKADGTTIGFGDWNDHINYSKDDAEWSQIEDFMKLQGDDVKYVAQRHGKMVLEVDGEEIEYTKDEVYDALAELYSGPELESKLTTKLQETLGKSLGGVDLSGVELSDLTAMDNFRNSIADSLAGTDMEGKTDQVFKGIMDSYGTGQEGIDAFKADTEFVDTLSPEFQDKMQALADGRITVEEFTGALREMNAEGQIDSMTDFFKQAAEGMGLSEEDAATMQNYAKHLMDVSDESDVLADSLKEDADSAADLAIEVTRMNKGVDKLADGFEDWSDILENSSEISAEYAEAMGEMKSALADVMDVEADLISNDFVVEHMEDIEKAATGDADAIDRLRAAMDEEIITNITLGQSEEFIAKVNELDAKVHELADNAPVVEVGAILDDADFLAAANNLVEQSGMTADEANAYFAGIGYEPVYSTEDIDNSAEVPNSLTRTSVAKIDWESADVDLGLFGTHSIKLPAVTTKTESVAQDPTAADGTMRLTSFSGDGKPPQIKGMRKKATGSQNNYSSSNKGGGSPGSSGGSKGGGSTPKAKEKFKIDKDQLKNLDEEKERYHEISNALESVGYELDEIADKKDRAFGKDKLKAMQEEEAALKKQIKLQQQYQKEIAENEKKDKKKVQDKYGAKINKEGDITNYDEMVESQTKAYNDAYKRYIDQKNQAVQNYNDSSRDDAASEKYDKAVEAADDEWKAAQQAYEDFQKDIAQYEETVDLFKESEASLREMENQLYDLQLEKIEYKVDLQIDFSDDELEYLEYQLERIEDRAFSAADAIANLGQQTKALSIKHETYKSGMQEIFANHGLSQDEFDRWLQGDEDVQKKLESMSLTESEVETLREYRDGLMDTSQAMIDLRESVHEKILSSFEEVNEELDKGISKIEHLQNVTEHFRNIVDIVGKANIPNSDKLIKSINETAVSQSKNKYEATAAKRDTAKANLDAAKKAYADQAGKISEEEKKMWEDSIAAMEEELMQFEEDAQADLESWMEAVNKQFEDSVQSTLDAFSKAVAGEAGTLAQLQDSFDRKATERERYLEDYEKIYEFSKLNRDIESSIDNTSNVQAKKELLQLQEEINALEESGAEVSEYQMENLRKRYELKLAELALEEAKNAKSEVRMTRDSEGNWGYTYTADETAVAAAEQSYEDKLYAIQQHNSEYINALQENIVTMQQEMADKLQEIAMDESLSIEEREAKMAEVQAFYQEQMDYYCDELELALGNNKKLYDEDWTDYAQKTGYKISKDEEYIDSFQETDLSVLTGFKNMEDYQANFNTASESLLDESSDAFDTWQVNMDAAFGAAGFTMENFADQADRELDKVKDDSQAVADKVKEDAGFMQGDYQEVINKIVEWENQYSQSISNMIGESDKIIEKFNSVLALWAQVKSVANEPTPTPDTGGGDDGGNNGGDGGGNGGGGGGGAGGGNGGKPSWDRVVAAYDKINQGKWGNGIQNRINKGKADGFTEAEVRAGQQLINYTYPTRLNGYGYSREKAKGLMGYDTGGYTGAWGDSSGKLALLHQKELVLNQEDTANMLSAIDMVRQISSMIDLNAMSSMKGLGAFLSAGGVGASGGVIEQHVEIHASFPDATNHSEIEEAFNNLLNSASQYANRKI